MSGDAKLCNFCYFLLICKINEVCKVSLGMKREQLNSHKGWLHLVTSSSALVTVNSLGADVP